MISRLKVLLIDTLFVFPVYLLRLLLSICCLLDYCMNMEYIYDIDIGDFPGSYNMITLGTSPFHIDTKERNFLMIVSVKLD